MSGQRNGRLGGVKGFSRPRVEHMSSNIFMMISYADISGHKNTHSLTLHPHSSQSQSESELYSSLPLLMYLTWSYFLSL